MDFLLKTFDLSDLAMLEEYVYYKQPILFSCRNSNGQIFLGFWLDETEIGESWLYVPMSSQRLQEIRTGKIELREAFLQSEEGFIFKVTTFYDNSPDVVTIVSCEQLDEDCLPMAGEFLKCDPQSIAVLA